MPMHGRIAVGSGGVVMVTGRKVCEENGWCGGDGDVAELVKLRVGCVTGFQQLHTRYNLTLEIAGKVLILRYRILLLLRLLV